MSVGALLALRGSKATVAIEMGGAVTLSYILDAEEACALTADNALVH
jgi:hypothetical protein